MTALPPLDAHAHIKPDIAAGELGLLNAVVLAASRSLAEGAQVTRRDDATTVWGVGCHPGLLGVQKAFDPTEFEALIDETALVSEVGLDGGSRVPIELQRATFQAVLRVLRTSPRIVSIHSSGATSEVLDEIENAGELRGLILHWWLGNAAETRRALDLGCYFSINASSLRKWPAIEMVPQDRLLVETDHPFGDRSNRAAARPGNVAAVEIGIADRLGISRDAVRRLIWHNFRALVQQTGVFERLPRRVRVLLSQHDAITLTPRLR